jgi:hypothetical protein
MPRGGRRTPAGGRPKGKPDRHMLVAKAMAAGETPAAAELIAWDQLANMAKLALNQVVTAQRANNTKELGPAIDRAHRILKDMLPYERRRLVGVTVGGDADNPIRTVTELDFSKLGDDQLAALIDILRAATPELDIAERPSGAGETTH